MKLALQAHVSAVTLAIEFTGHVKQTPACVMKEAVAGHPHVFVDIVHIYPVGHIQASEFVVAVVAVAGHDMQAAAVTYELIGQTHILFVVQVRELEQLQLVAFIADVEEFVTHAVQVKLPIVLMK
jgi:uncharacterized Zn-finger protein